jgi:hypothetical protein
MFVCPEMMRREPEIVDFDVMFPATTKLPEMLECPEIMSLEPENVAFVVVFPAIRREPETFA